VRLRVRERPTASAAISDSRQNAAAASQAQSVEHQTLHLRSRGCRRRADASVLPRRRAWRPWVNTRPSNATLWVASSSNT